MENINEQPNTEPTIENREWEVKYTELQKQVNILEGMLRAHKETVTIAPQEVVWA